MQRFSRHTIALTLSLTLLASTVITQQYFFPQTADSRARNSALSQLIKNDIKLYLPTRLVIGKTARFTMRAPVGHKVVLFLSPQPEGFTAPNGQALRVGSENQRFETTANEKGVAFIDFPIPDEKGLANSWVFVDGFTYHADDYSDLKLLEQFDHRGHKADANRLAIVEQAQQSGPMILPSMGGIDSNMLRRLSTLGDIEGDDRKKELVDDGDIKSDTILDKNSFITRPDGSGGI